MFCKNCGYEIKEDTRFCPECGSAVTAENNASSSDSSVSSNHVTNQTSSENTDTFTCRIYHRGKALISESIRQYQGAYTAEFMLKQNRLLIKTIDNYGETVYSIPYYLIQNATLTEKISIGLVILYVFALSLGIFSFSTNVTVGILVLILVVVWFLLFGAKKTMFSATLSDGTVVKIKRIIKLRKRETAAKQKFFNSLNAKISSAVNTGEAYETATTIILVGDAGTGITTADKKAMVDEIINKDE
jgi:hypothetical protein